MIQRAIQQDAYFLWESDGRPEGKQDYYWQRATERMQDTSFRLRALKRLRGSASGVNVWRRFINWWEKTPVERGLETFVADLKNLAFLELLGLVANITIIISLGTYLFTEKQRRDAEIFNAWQTITSADGTGGNGGRRRALEFLNASPANLFNDYGGAHWRRRFPWICVPLTQVCPLWRREPLDGLDVSNAYLAGIELPNVSLTRATLTETDLRGANLFSANLRKADLFSANLQDADLRGANLGGTNLQEADLQEANLWFANLKKADLWRANLRNADLFAANLLNADLFAANLFSANLQEADLFAANLQEANLGGTNLQEVNLRGANLQEADLFAANLQKADLFRANLRNADLFAANLQEADLFAANLQKAVLWRANLRKADLFAANLQEALLLTTDLRQTRQLTTEQLMGANPPLLCNVALPSDMEKVDPNRDCDELPQVWSDRYPISLETAQSIVNGAQQKQWE
ncbi:MAG: pentapeptide repeat-containing protein [Elainellaceae cyanobacterium]